MDQAYMCGRIPLPDNSMCMVAGAWLPAAGFTLNFRSAAHTIQASGGFMVHSAVCVYVRLPPVQPLIVK
jgi:hypothetical protein